MQTALNGQEPKFLLISPINRSAQDLDLLGFEQGDAFNATRVPNMILPVSEQSPFLFGGPASYYAQFPKHDGIIITFEQSEDTKTIEQTLENISLHSNLTDIPIIGLKVDYSRGIVAFIAHKYQRAYEHEVYLRRRLFRPNDVDTNTLSILCSDSRVRPPETPKGNSMSIQTLGGFIPKYSTESNEVQQLDSFLDSWLEMSNMARIIIIAHGAFDGEGQSCGAAKASLGFTKSCEDILNNVLGSIKSEAIIFETKMPDSPEERAVTIAHLTKNNLLSYPSIMRRVNGGLDSDSFIEIIRMDTITNIISNFEND